MAGMSRLASADYLAGVLSHWFTETGIVATDDPQSLAEIIDDSLLAVGTDYDDLATAEVTSNIAGYRMVLKYMGLLKVQSAYLKADLTLDGPQMSKRYGSVMEALRKAVEAAKDAAMPFMTTTNEWGTGVIVGDWLEPAEVA